MLRERIYYAFVVVVVLLAIGTVFYVNVEGWSYVDSFYFSTITLTTIGFGDFAPTSPGAKIFTSIYALLGIGIMLYMLSSVIGVFIFKQERYFDKLFFPVRRMRKKEMEIEKEKKRIEREKEEMEKEEDKIEKYAKDIKAKEMEIKKEEEEIDKLKRKIEKRAGK